MPTYLHRLNELHQEGREYVSCTELAEYMNIELIVARKDIAMTGLAGSRRRGYRVDELIQAIRTYIGWDQELPAVMVGAGALGSALSGHPDFAMYGLQIRYLFDHDPEKIGKVIHGRTVLSMDKLCGILDECQPKIGIICVSAKAAQGVADMLVSHGVRYLWNFSDVCLTVPEYVIVQREVIAGGLALLAAKIKTAENGETPAVEE